MSFVPEGWQASSSELAGKTVLVTGANRGIGEAVALSCAQHGAEVLLLGRDECVHQPRRIHLRMVVASQEVLVHEVHEVTSDFCVLIKNGRRIARFRLV